MGGKSAGSRLSGKGRAAADDRSAKRHKSYSIKQFLKPAGQAAAAAAAGSAQDRDSSEEPEDQLPSQTPAVPLLAAAAQPSSTLPSAAGAKLQTALLRSLQHRFVTQQALETPAHLAAAGSSNQLQQGQAGQGAAAAAAADGGWPATESAVAHGPEDIEEEEGEEDQDDVFTIFSQLEAYEPTFLSQRPPDTLLDGGGAGGGASQRATQSQQALPLSQQQRQQGAQPPGAAAPCGRGADGAGPEAEDPLEWPCGSQLLSQPAAAEGDAQRRVSNVSAVTLKTTPALQSSERVRCDGGGNSGQKMFPLFRKRDSFKRLYIVRHGESTYNAAMSARGSSWEDPHIFDAVLTERGRNQARALQQQLKALDLPPDTLWLTSPLQRAMQTLLLACPHAHLLEKSASGGSSSSGGGGSMENSSAAPNGGSQLPKVIILPCITEKVVTSGDIGHPASELRKRFPQLDSQLATLPEQWWHCPPNKPNCAVQKRFGSHEPKDAVMSRIGAFRRWLQDRPETVIVAVGHSSYWRTFEEVCRGTKPSHMHNCEFRLIQF